MFKLIFLLFVALLLVLMGMNNRSTVAFSLPPLLPKSVTLPSALMYVAFFSVGVITGCVVMAGNGKGKGSGSSAGKSSKPK
ncbi:MAG: hypothetical protein SFY81_05535 [Verrucomicrobiota bacterium]|nr:hypothetical protein [Verrucomicrobiota bacterium]